MLFMSKLVTRMHSSRMRTAHSSSRRGGSASVHAGIDPRVWAWRPPSQISLNFPLGCGPGDPPGQIPLNFPLGVGLQTTPGHIPFNFPLACGPGDTALQPDPLQLPPWMWAWKPARHAEIPPWRPAARHAGIPPAMHAGIPSPP